MLRIEEQNFNEHTIKMKFTIQVGKGRKYIQKYKNVLMNADMWTEQCDTYD